MPTMGVVSVLRVSRRLFGVMAAVECGSLHCQRDSYARSLDTVVLSCRPSPPEDRKHGAYAVILENTVLFPEGGGQVRCLG